MEHKITKRHAYLQIAISCRPAAMHFRMKLAVVLFLHVLSFSLAKSDDDVTCISDVDASKRRIKYNNDAVYDVRVDRPLLSAALLSIVRIHLPCNLSQDLQEARLCEDAECDGNNSSTVTVVAARNRMFHKLGPLLYDVLTLGAMEVSERVNITDMLLPSAPCEDREDEVYRETARLVRQI